MDLALNNLQMLTCHKSQPTNQRIVTWSTTEGREIKNVPNPSMFELAGHPKNDRYDRIVI